jgi:hypothetical protein
MSSPIALQEFLKAGFEDFIIPSYEAAPFSTIQNRAKVVRSLKAIAGVERIMCKGINSLPNEFGPNGEQVWESSDKDSRVRFVGSGWYSNSNTQGSRPVTITVNDYVETVFYGTGLNIMINVSNTIDIRATVDGGAEGSNIIPATLSDILNARNYGNNTIFPIVAGLTLGWHHVKIREANTAGLPFYGFEILNERTNLAVYSGQGISNGSSQGLSALTTSAFNAGVSGTRGARVVKYIQGGVVSQAVQEVDATSKYLTLADHTNEEVVRRINFREFGANRADDFSTLAGVVSDRAFTLDDGTTTLVGNDIATTGEPLNTQAVNAFITLTFVGCGLDVILSQSTASAMDVIAITVDGVSTGSLSGTGDTTVRLVKIVSGLPYGTHTVKFNRNTAAGAATFYYDFIIYQPKKPAIPAGAFAVAPYNLMADYVGTSLISAEGISAGTLAKTSMREIVYVGTWTTAVNTSVRNGMYVSSSTAANYCQYTFFGTGVDIMANVATSGTVTINIDGVNYSGAATPSVGTWSQPVWTMGTTNGGRLRISGLSLGTHTIKITITTNVGGFFLHALDIITPIHAQESSFKVGSNSLKSVTKYSPEKSISNAGPDLSKAKAWVNFDITNQKISSSFNISAVLRVSAGSFQVFFEKPFKNSSYSIGGFSGVMEMTINSATANSTRVTVNGSTGTPTDTGYASLIFFGELQDEQ